MIAVPSAKSESIKDIYEELHDFAKTLKVLPSLENILQDKPISNQLKDVGVEDLLARHPKGLDKNKISDFIDGKVVMITGAGGSINPGNDLKDIVDEYQAGLISVNGEDDVLYDNAVKLLDSSYRDKIISNAKYLLNDKFAVSKISKQILVGV